MILEIFIVCPRCGRAEPDVTFGIAKARKSGRNLYCRECINKRRMQDYYDRKNRVEARRLERSRIKAGAQMDEQEQVEIRIRPTALEKVRALLSDGLTREQLADRAEISVGDACDILAILWNKDEAKAKNGRWYPKQNGSAEDIS